MKRELEIARYGLACCLCSENVTSKLIDFIRTGERNSE